MMIKRIAGWATVGVLSLALGGVALAGPGMGGHGGGISKVFRALDLTDSQKAVAMDAREDVKEVMESSRTERQELNEAFKAELTSATPSASVLADIVDAQVALGSEVRHAELDAFLEVYDVLTPAQKAELAELLENPPERGERGVRRGPPSSDEGVRRGPPSKGSFRHGPPDAD